MKVQTTRQKALNYLCHHGIEGQKWGVKHGPPYPLDDSVSTGDKLKSRSKKSLSVEERTYRNLNGLLGLALGGPIAGLIAGGITSHNLKKEKENRTEKSKEPSVEVDIIGPWKSDKKTRQKAEELKKYLQDPLNGDRILKEASEGRKINISELKNYSAWVAVDPDKTVTGIAQFSSDLSKPKPDTKGRSWSGKVVTAKVLTVEIQDDGNPTDKIDYYIDYFDAVDGDNFGEEKLKF